MEYIVKHRYASSIGGPWAAGQIVDISEAEAVALNNDSPGVVERVAPPPKAERAVAEPAATRQVKTAPATRKASR